MASNSNQQEIINELLQLAVKLAAKGITPQVATLKAHFSKPVSLPLLIEAIKLWKNLDKEALKQTVNSVFNQDSSKNTNSKDASNIDKDNIEELKAQISALRDEICVLRQEIKSLHQAIKTL